MNILLGLLTALAVLQQGQGIPPDPCNDYTEINDVRRSTNYTLPSNENGLCDMDLDPGWYRFTIKARTKMPEFCPASYQCGTWVPVWMKGSHPTTVGQVVDRTACAYYGTDPRKPCCDHTIDIRVKKCPGDFFVYYLQPTSTCPVAYCAESEKPCPAGQGSQTGFSPCEVVYPLSITSPTFTGPNVGAQEFNFTCQVTYPNNERNLAFEVEWTFDGQRGANHSTNRPISTVTLTNGNRVAVLPGKYLRGNMDSLLRCRARAWYMNSTVTQKGPWRQSEQSHYVGFRVEPARVVMTDATKASVRISSTVPVLCNHKRRCCISIALNPKSPVRMGNECTYQICAPDWNSKDKTAYVNISLVPGNQNVHGNKPVSVAFNVNPPIGLAGDYLPIFTNYILPEVSVTNQRSPPIQCSWVGDPHITGFSGNYIHLYEPGDFIMFRNDGDNFEIQSRTHKCRRAACQCGLMIKEENDYIHINNCPIRRHTPAPTIQTSQTLRLGTVIQRSNDGRDIKVYLPSGREVRLDIGYYTNTYLKVAAGDRGRGICGTPGDGNPNNEYTFRNGTVLPDPCVNKKGHCLPISFFESWRANWSLFNTPTTTAPDDAQYCQCIGGEVTCPKLRRRRKRETEYTDMDEPESATDPDENGAVNGSYHNVTWPTANGITEDQARAFCVAALRGSQLYTESDDSSDVMLNTLAGCVQDIKYLDSYDMVEGSVAAFTHHRMFHMLQDINNYDTDDQGELVLKPSVPKVCSTSCFHHGSCVNGSCVCQPGFTGSNCQLVQREAPRLLRIRGSSVCDVNQRPCRKIFMDAEGFEGGDLFQCRVHDILSDKYKNDMSWSGKAQFINDMRLACPLPDHRVKTERSVRTFEVSFTYDGVIYSNALNVTVFDSTCQDCDVMGCQRKPNTCLINNLCYVDGDVKPDDASKVCNTSLSTSQWSDVPGTSSPPLLSTSVIRCFYKCVNSFTHP